MAPMGESDTRALSVHLHRGVELLHGFAVLCVDDRASYCVVIGHFCSPKQS